MANQFSGGRWVIDTASATPITLQRIGIVSIQWVSSGAALGDRAVLTDAGGNIIWESVAPGTDFVSDPTPIPPASRFRSGLVAPTLASGRIYIDIL